MEGHFLVCENEEEEFDISFQVNSTMDSVIPKDQQELYVKAESACNIIKALENTYMVNNSSSRKRYASPKAGTELYLDLVFRQ